MPMGTDRRSVLTGLGALGVMGCDQQTPQRTPPLKVVPTLRVDFSGLEARHGGRIGIDAWSEQGAVSWRGRERFVYCSTFKMYLAAATFLRVQGGEESLDRQVPITRDDMVNHAPVTEPSVGSSLSVERLMQAVVEVSDNPAANLLLKAMGGIAPMQAFYRGIGDQTTTADRFEPEMNRLDGDKDTIQPAQSRINLHRLFEDSGTPLSPSSKEKLLGWMFASPTGTARIKAGVPAGWRVAHKTGTGGYGPTNDIGLLYPPTGAPITLAVYYHGVRTSSDAENEAVIADATRQTLSALGYA